MAVKISRNSPCPCGSGKKYKQCCINKDFDWVEMEDGQIGRSVSLEAETVAELEKLRQGFVARHGREPDRIFEEAPPLEVVEHLMVEAMKKGGVEPALVYAFEETGLLLSDQNERRVPNTDIKEWEAAIDKFERQTGTKAARRRLNDQDLQGMLANGPRQ